MNDLTKPLLLEPLTDRERDILKLIAEGLSNPEIADRLILGLETVRWYTKQIYSKLGVHSRTQASMRARDLGLLSDETISPAVPSAPSNTQQHLPSYATPFIGREYEFSELTELLDNPNVRLITIVGAGGMGKTRLAVELARSQINNFNDGVYFISLASVLSPSAIDLRIANRLNMRLRDGEDVRSQLLQYLQTRQVLLVLDNFEHLMDGADLVSAILEASPTTKILVTSHVSLNLRDEWVRYLDALAVPDNADIDDPTAYSAIKLFEDCVRRVRGDFSVVDHLDCVIQICRVVQGIPLALELAAVWLKTLSCEDVAEQIQRNIDFLASNQRDIEERHRSIQAVFEYAWNLLSPEEQRVFRRLSVFPGGFGLAAAEQVAGASIHILSELVGRSLLQQSSSGLYHIHNLLRQYAERKLEDLDITMRSVRSSHLLAWTSFVKGNFDRVEELAQATLEATSDSTNDSEKAFALGALGVLAGIDEDYPRSRQLCEASQRLVQTDPIASIISNLGLAIACCGSQDMTSSKHYIREAMKQATALRIPAFIVLCLPLTSIVLAYEAEPERAVELLALAYTHPASSLGWIKKWPLIIQLESELENELGEAEFHALWERGKQLDLEQTSEQLITQL
jgi:predicted ATPase/DNA-binding CsgD family transcriptional regulator